MIEVYLITVVLTLVVMLVCEKIHTGAVLVQDFIWITFFSVMPVGNLICMLYFITYSGVADTILKKKLF